MVFSAEDTSAQPLSDSVRGRSEFRRLCCWPVRSITAFILLTVCMSWTVVAQDIALDATFLEARQHQTLHLKLDNPAAPVYDVIALRVEFQPDTSRFTTGSGTFNGALFDTLTARVDPLPHDAAYFEAHLQFLQNYVAKVSDGQTILRTHLIPEVIRVSGQMGDYSPTGPNSDSDAELSKLARLPQEAWSLASNQSAFDVSGFDPATTAFILFHAGVGRDIELVGTTLDKTPQDIPTIYFDDRAFSRLLGEPVSFKSFPIDHTIILPRTESRIGFDFIQDVPFLIEFSINGLMAASFFNYLGVPDLFDTSTGQSAIGPFGLMDPLGLFAYNGLFAPEPSAWTKQYLGWADPVVIEGNTEQVVSLVAASSADGLEMARVPVSSAEYFLVENRYRDLADDGLTLTIYRDGQFVEQRFENGQDDFNSINIDAFEGGVVVDADDFDWALPGGKDEEGNGLVGGMLIWHIDERILAEGLPANRVNVDPERRAVDLEEADSAQDIGFPPDNPFAPQTHLGSPFDYFYEGNPVVVITSSGEEIRLYQNRFGPDTYPNSNTNAGGESFVTISNFSAPGPEMSFSYEVDPVSRILPLDGFTSDTVAAAVPVGSYVTARFDPTSGVAYLKSSDELAISTQGGPFSVLDGGTIKAPVFLLDDRLVALAVEPDNTASLYIQEPTAISRVLLGIQADNGPTDTDFLLYEHSGERLVALLDEGDLYSIKLSSDNQAQVTPIGTVGNQVFSIVALDDGRVASLGENGVSFESGETAWTYTLDADASAGQLVLGVDASGLIGAFTHISGEKLILLQLDGVVQEVDLTPFEPAGSSFELNRYPILVDLDGDRRLEVLFTYGPNILAFSMGGGLADGFPIALPAPVSTQPLIAAMGTYEGWTVFAGAIDGNLYAIDTRTGRPAPGFPLASGFSLTATPLLHQNQVFTVDAAGKLSAWTVNELNGSWWGQQHADRFNTNFVRLMPDGENQRPDGLFFPGEVYNWPNPVREGLTHFRLWPAQDVDVTIKIVDGAGTLIDELTPGTIRGGASVDIPWRTEASSGLYFARVEAVTSDGTRETALIKMAIIR